MAGKTNQPQLPQRQKSMKVSCEDLSYHSMTVETCGKVMNKEQKEKLREKYGYCVSCQGAPTLCFDVTKSRINPLWSSKEARTVEGECFEGHCLKCHPEKDPRRQKFAATKIGSGVVGSRRLNGSNHTSSTSSRKEIQRDLSNGSLALSQSRRDLFRASQGRMASTEPTVIRETSSSSLGSMGSAGSFSSANSSGRRLNAVTPPRPPTVPNPVGDLVRATSTPCPNTSNRSTDKEENDSITAPPDIQRSRSAPLEQESLATLAAAGTRERATIGNNKPPSLTSLSSTEASSSDEEVTTREEVPTTLRRASSASAATPPLPPAQASGSMESSSLHSRPKTIKRNAANLSHLKSPVATTTSAMTVTTITEDAPVHAPAEDETVANLKGLMEELADACDYDFLVEVLVNAIQSYNKEKVKIVCFETIVKICKKDSKNKQRLIGTNIMEEMVFALKNFGYSEEVQEKAASAMATLSNNKKARQALVQSGACRLLVRILQNFSEKSSVVGAAMAALRGLSPEPSASEPFKMIVASKYVCETMGKHLSIMTLQRDGCAFLSNVSIDMEKQDVSIVSRDLLRAVVEALREHKDSEALVSVACFALRNLTCEESRKNLRTLRGVEGVFGLFEDQSESNKILDLQDAYDVLERLQLSQAEDESLEDQALENLQVVVALKDGKAEAITDVSDLLKTFDWSIRVTTECLRTLASLGGQSDAHVAAIREVGLKSLIALMNGYTSCTDVMEQGVRLLEIVAKAESSSKQDLHEAGVTDLLLEFLKGATGSLETGESAFSALKDILGALQSWDDKVQGLKIIDDAMKHWEGSESVQSSGKAILAQFGDEKSEDDALESSG